MIDQPPRPDTEQLLRESRRPWYVLADSVGLPPWRSETGSRCDADGRWHLHSIGVGYGDEDDEHWLRVSVIYPPEPPLMERYLNDRLGMAAAAIAPGEASYDHEGMMARIAARSTEAAQAWTDARLVVDGEPIPARRTATGDYALVHAQVDDTLVSVLTRDWPSPIALLHTLDLATLATRVSDYDDE